MNQFYLTIEFVANVLGLHRICYLIPDGDPLQEFDCTNTVTCTTVGETLTENILVTLDNDTCDEVVFEGYVQAECQQEESLDGRIPFTVTFTPVPTCTSYMLRCNSSGVASVTLDNVGSGYNPAVPPVVTFTGGGGTLAHAHAIVGDGGLKTWTITSGGTVYNGGGSAIFQDVAVLPITGAGTGGICDVTVTSGVITAIALTSSDIAPGSGFVVGNDFKFLAADLGGNTGTEASINVDSINTGEIQYIDIITAGSAYTSAPLVDIADPVSGVTALGTVVMEECPEMQYVLCNSNTSLKLSPELGQQFIVCDPTPSTLIPALEIGYTVVASGCCFDCVQIQFKPDVECTLTYTDCGTTGDIVSITTADPQTICAVNNSWFVSPADAPFLITIIGDCPPA